MYSRLHESSPFSKRVATSGEKDDKLRTVWLCDWNLPNHRDHKDERLFC